MKRIFYRKGDNPFYRLTRTVSNLDPFISRLGGECMPVKKYVQEPRPLRIPASFLLIQ